MKIGFMIPVLGLKQYGDVYLSIVRFLEKKGHEVIHPLSVTEEQLLSWTPKQREFFFSDYYTKVNKSESIIAECSYPCINMGFEIANLIQQGKEIIILKAKNAQLSLKDFDPLYNNKNIYLYEYHLHNLIETVDEALSFNPSQKYKKYNILFTPTMVAKLDQIAKKKQLPKSVYIRQLLEKGLASDDL